MDYINAFWVGGLICALVQILLEKTKLLPGNKYHRRHSRELRPVLRMLLPALPLPPDIPACPAACNLRGSARPAEGSLPALRLL